MLNPLNYVYALSGEKMFHTAYNSFESKPKGRDYIGKHSTEDPYDDYKGSFKDKEFDPDSKITMAYAKTAEGAVWFEINFQNVFDVVLDPQYANQVKQTSTGFDRTGVKCSEETKQKISESMLGDKHPLFGVVGEDNPSFGYRHTDEAKQKVRDARTGTVASDETKQKLRKARLGEKNHNYHKRGEKSPHFGKRGEGTNNFGKSWYVNAAGETRMSKEPPGPEWQQGRKWK